MKSQYILYLFNVDLLLKDDQNHARRTKNDMTQIVQWHKGSANIHPIFLVGTHCDQDPEYKKCTEESIGEYYGKIEKLPAVQNMKILCGTPASSVLLLGSLESKESAQKLCDKVWKELIGQ